MSRQLHHGENGAYKTSGALNDVLIPAVKQGRTIISNIRGLVSKEKISKACFKSESLLTQIIWSLFPSRQPIYDFELYHLDINHKTNGQEQLEQLRRFFHWAPKGALIIFDEIDEIYDPQEFTLKRQSEYDYPEFMPNTVFHRSSVENAHFNDRPTDLKRSFSKHRHWKWDIVTTSVDIDLVHPIIKKGADNAFRHINMANVLGVLGRGKYRELVHHPKKNGMSTDAKSVTTKKIPSYMFNIYESTTDEDSKVQDTIAGTSIFSNPKFKFIFIFILLAGANTFYQRVIKDDESTKTDTESVIKPETNTKPEKEKSFAERVYQKANIQSNKTDVQDTKVTSRNISSSDLPTKSNSSDNTADLISNHFIDSLMPMVVFSGKPLKEAYFRTPDNRIKFTSTDLKKYNIKINYTTFSTGYFSYKDKLVFFSPGEKATGSMFGSLPKLVTKAIEN